MISITGSLSFAKLGEVTNGLIRQPAAPIYADVQSHPCTEIM